MQRYIKKYYNKKLLFISAFGIIIAGIIPALLLPVRGKMIDFALTSSNKFLPYALLLIVLVFSQAALANIQERISKIQQIAISHGLDKERLKHCVKLPFTFTETEEFFKLNAEASEAPSLMEEIYACSVSALQCAVQLVSTLISICFVNAYVAIGIVLLICIGFALNSLQVKNIINLWTNYRQNIRKGDYLSGILLKTEFVNERKIFNFEADIEKAFDIEHSKALKANTKLGMKRLALESFSQIANACFTVVALMLLAKPLWNKSITLGIFLSAFYATIRLIPCTNQLISSAYTYAANLKKLLPYEILMKKEKEQENPSTGAKHEEFQTLEFRNVSFQYPNTKEAVLKDISFKLEKGKHYALVGENGSGKTTLLKCLIGLYPPKTGEILINQKSINSFYKNTLHKMLTAVFQDYYHYPLSLRENILLCTEKEISDESIFSTMKSLHMEELLKNLPNGIDSELLLMKEKSTELSGGEWQKLSVIRCILSDSSFAMLDEPNSALDPIVEASIYEAYKKMLSNKTTMFISHRLGSVKIADEILVLKDGRILAQGSHNELMKSCNYYATLFETQKGFYEK